MSLCQYYSIGKRSVKSRTFWTLKNEFGDVMGTYRTRKIAQEKGEIYQEQKISEINS